MRIISIKNIFIYIYFNVTPLNISNWTDITRVQNLSHVAKRYSVKTVNKYSNS